ncbi:tetrahydromethanopterin S-methyltransferase subunit H [Candidatus Bathyarchaeota archaeon]|nr:MAG: tetrahydromethanopterin S-methyltransferase subunit H [Candidatus Bathyarchaeota archaeon]
MFEFKSKQQTFNIGGVKVGGLPGQNPTVLIGTIFYHGHKAILDKKTGEFDRKLVEEEINLQEEFSDKTGNPGIFDVVGATPELMRKYVEFTASVTDAPIMIDGTTAEAKIAGLEYAKEVGLIDRLIYNSLIPEYKQEEIDKIKEVGLKSALLLAYNPKEFTTAGRVKAIKQLLEVAKEAGIEKPLLDTCVLDIPGLGMASRAAFELKNEFGLPVGNGAHNAVSLWKGLKSKMGVQAVKPAVAAACVVAVATGADFVLYGPVKDAQYVFPVIAMTNAAYGYLLFEKKISLDRSHPLYRIA